MNEKIKAIEKELKKLDDNFEQQRKAYKKLKKSLARQINKELGTKSDNEMSLNYSDLIKLTKLYVNDESECEHCDGEGSYYDMAGDDNCEEPLLFPCDKCKSEGTVTSKDLDFITYDRNMIYKGYLKYLLIYVWESINEPHNTSDYFLKQKFDSIINTVNT